MPKPSSADIDDAVLTQLRDICLRFPETIEDKESVGNPAFKVGNKIFAMQHGADNRMSLWFKAPPGLQDAVVTQDSSHYFVPPYVGHRGWIGAWLDDGPDWDALADFIDESYRMTAPKRLLRTLDSVT